MKIVGSTLFFRDRDLNDAIFEMAQKEIKNIEICGEKKHCDPNLWGKSIDEIKNLIKKLGISINSIHTPFYKGEEEKEADNWLKEAFKTIEAAYLLNAFFIVIHTRLFHYFIKKEDFKPIYELLDYAHKNKVKIAVENEPFPNEGVRGVKEVIKLFDREEVGICYDISHIVASGEDPLTCISQLDLSKLLSIHLSDNFTDQGRDIHLPLGKGNIEWEKVIEFLFQTQFEGSVVLEINWDREGGGIKDSFNKLTNYLNSIPKRRRENEEL